MAAAAPAGAAQVDLAGGATTLKLDRKAAAALTSLGVKVAPTGKAKAGKAGVAFPITGGRIDPATGVGTIRHTGGLRLSAGKVKVTLSDYTVRVSPKGSTMTAKVGSARVGVLVPVIGKAKVTRSGLGTRVSNVAIHLSSKGAAALNKAFGVSAFKPRLKLGTATIAATPKQIAFTGGQTDLAVDPNALAALTSLGITPGLVGDAKANADGTFGFPITEGLVDAKTLTGTVGHSGGISLTRGATVVTLSDFTIDTTAKQLTAAINNGARAAILDLDLSAPKVGIDGRDVTVGGVGAKLTQGAADALNQAFGTTAFAGGLQFGVATVRGSAA